MSYRPTLIDPGVAREYLAGGKAVAVDARTYVQLADDQIPGAQHIDPNGAAVDRLLAELPRDTLLVCYCDEPAQAASLQVARRARALGRDAVVIDGGMRAWTRAGFVTELREVVALGALLPTT